MEAVGGSQPWPWPPSQAKPNRTMTQAGDSEKQFHWAEEQVAQWATPPCALFQSLQQVQV